MAIVVAVITLIVGIFGALFIGFLGSMRTTGNTPEDQRRANVWFFGCLALACVIALTHWFHIHVSW